MSALSNHNHDNLLQSDRLYNWLPRGPSLSANTQQQHEEEGDSALPTPPSPPSPFPLAPVDSHLLNKCYSWFNQVVHLCQQPRMHLKNSPPYLLHTIPDIYEKLQHITGQYDNDFTSLSQIQYFSIFIRSVVDLCERIVQLFVESKEDIFIRDSHSRSQLTKFALTFSHLHKDLDALFPNGKFYSNFRLTKPAAASWWSTNFGKRVIVSWITFQSALERTFEPDWCLADSAAGSSLRDTIDLTRNGYVSIFEFDVFVRLFSPWPDILKTWEILTLRHPGYMAFMTYDEVRAILNPLRHFPGPGSFVFRLSCTKLGRWAIGYVTRDGKILQTIIQNKSLVQTLLDGERDGFYRYPNGHQVNPINLLLELSQNSPLVRHQVTKEQYQAYCETGSTFELCKICDENNKDVQLEPCGHFICKICLFNCQLAGHNQICPFCRVEIKGIEPVVLDPYNPFQTTISKSSPILTSVPPCSFPDTVSNTTPQPVTYCQFPINPPPVPPRTIYESLETCIDDGGHEITNPLLTTNDSQSNAVFVYPKILFSNQPCFTPPSTNGTVAEPSDILESNLVLCEQAPVDPTPSPTKYSLQYAQLDLTNSDSESDIASNEINHPPSDALLVGSHNQTETTPIGDPIDESLVQILCSTYCDLNDSNARLLLRITNNQLEMCKSFWKHFMPRPSDDT